MTYAQFLHTQVEKQGYCVRLSIFGSMACLSIGLRGGEVFKYLLEATSNARRPKLYVVQSKSALEGALLRFWAV
jgi:hypothetical protein